MKAIIVFKQKKRYTDGINSHHQATHSTLFPISSSAKIHTAITTISEVFMADGEREIDG
jgi:hypothetical protein